MHLHLAPLPPRYKQLYSLGGISHDKCRCANAIRSLNTTNTTNATTRCACDMFSDGLLAKVHMQFTTGTCVCDCRILCLKNLDAQKPSWTPSKKLSLPKLSGMQPPFLNSSVALPSWAWRETCHIMWCKGLKGLQKGPCCSVAFLLELHSWTFRECKKTALHQKRCPSWHQKVKPLLKIRIA